MYPDLDRNTLRLSISKHKKKKTKKEEEEGKRTKNNEFSTTVYPVWKLGAVLNQLRNLEVYV